MWRALAHGQAEMFLRLLDASGNPEASKSVRNQRMTLLGLAVERGELELAKALVARGANVDAVQRRHSWERLIPSFAADSIFCPFCDETTALGLAARAGNLEMCKFLLLEAHAEIDAPGISNTGHPYVPLSPLAVACGNGHIEIAKFLVDHGASVRLADKNGVCAHCVLCRRSSLLELFIRQFSARDDFQPGIDLCKFLVQKGALLGGALIASAAVKNLDLVRLFLNYNAPLHAPTWSRSTKTALGTAIESGDVAIAQSIHDAGGVETGQLDAIPDEEMMGFMEHNGLLDPALLQYASDIVASAIRVPDENKTLLRRILLYDDLDLSNTGAHSMGPLECAIEEDLDLELIEFLLRRGAPVRQRTLKVVVRMIANLRREAYAKLRPTYGTSQHQTRRSLQSCPQVYSYVQWDTQTFCGDAPDLPAIVDAAKEGLRDVVQMMLRNMDWGSRQVGVALTTAIAWGNYLVAEDLLDSKPLPSLEESYGNNYGGAPNGSRAPMSALVAAARSGRVFLAKKLIEAKAKVNREVDTLNGYTALQAAAELGHGEMVDLLLGNGADPNGHPAENFGITALQVAAMKGHLSIVHKLLDYGAEVNQPGALATGRTAIESAAEYGRLEILDLLLRRGGKIVCSWGKHNHAVWLAKRGGHMVAARLLMSQEEITLLDVPDTPHCTDDDGWDDSDTESSASNHYESPGADDGSDAEVDTYSEVRSAGIADGVESEVDTPQLNPSLEPGPAISETMISEEAGLLWAEERDWRSAVSPQVPGPEVEGLAMHSIDEGTEFGFWPRDQPDHSNELEQLGFNGEHGMDRNMEDLMMVEWDWKDIFDPDDGGAGRDMI
ncbi:hypothetical protein MFIFM68171_02939 [Madurella fahalii]|uniref:Ankyrin n=1 Tax=Madurella fahalii TaxID=1157608 RepID=A0ABQ0G4T4_9PEZI